MSNVGLLNKNKTLKIVITCCITLLHFARYFSYILLVCDIHNWTI